MTLYLIIKFFVIVHVFYGNNAPTLIHNNGNHSHISIKPKSQCDLKSNTPRAHKFKYNLALITTLNSNEESDDKKKDIGLEVVKDKIINELKQSEDILKGILSRITDHVVQYVKHRLVQQFLQFYIINPLGMGVGNLLNTELNNSYVTRIPKDANPNDFNMEYEEVDVPSNFGSKVPKRCWLIKSHSEHATKTFVLLHGWFGNMQSCLPFANIINKLGLLKDHHVLIVDLHDHVGRSYESNVGLKGVMDLYDTLVFMSREYGVTDFKLYAQSISCISALVFYDCFLKVKSGLVSDHHTRTQCCKFVSNTDAHVLKELNINSIILESPVANIQSYLTQSLPESINWLAQQAISSLDTQFGGHSERLSLGTYLSNSNIGGIVHILQGLEDSISPSELLYDEFIRFKVSPSNLYIFENGGHGDLSATVPEDYYDTVDYILNYGGVWRLFKYARNKTRNLEQLKR